MHPMSSSTVASVLRRASERQATLARAVMYRTDPVLWMRERLGMTLWSIQKLIAQSVVDNKKTAVKSCHGIGKSYLAALIICWWIDVHPEEETMVVTTAPSDSQVKKILWEYVRKIHRKYGLRGTITENAEWKTDGSRNLIGYGRKPADTNMNAFQGQHIKYLLAVVDEAGGVPQSIWTGVEAITTMDTNRVLVIGNPDEANTEFGRIFLKNNEDWTKFSVSALDSPNLTEEWKYLPAELCELLVSKNWVEEKRKNWGESDRRYISRVLAEFPGKGQDALFNPLMITEAVERTIIPPINTRRVFGVDVARFGVDRSVVVCNDGGVITIVDSWDQAPTTETAARVHKLAIDLGAAEVRVDAAGLGAGVVDQLVEIPQRNYLVIEVNGAGSSPDPVQWYNYRAYLFDNVKSLMTKELLSLPENTYADDDEATLAEELEGVHYKFMRGAMLIESKDDIKRRGGKSPDYADALTYACAPFDVDAPLAGYAPGDQVEIDAVDVIGDELLYGGAIAPY